jgi:transcriptional regulator with XRE-family HTH domain
VEARAAGHLLTVTEGHTTMSPRRLGRMLRDKRETKGMSQMELAKVARVGRTYIVKLESGDKRNPSLEILKRLAKALGVPVTELLE